MTKFIAQVSLQRGYVTSSEIQKLSPDEIAKILPFGAFAWGSHAMCRAERMRRLGWKPKHPDVFSTLEETVVHQAYLLGKGAQENSKISH